MVEYLTKRFVVFFPTGDFAGIDTPEENDLTYFDLPPSILDKFSEVPAEGTTADRVDEDDLPELPIMISEVNSNDDFLELSAEWISFFQDNPLTLEGAIRNVFDKWDPKNEGYDVFTIDAAQYVLVGYFDLPINPDDVFLPED